MAITNKNPNIGDPERCSRLRKTVCQTDKTPHPFHGKGLSASVITVATNLSGGRRHGRDLHRDPNRSCGSSHGRYATVTCADRTTHEFGYSSGSKWSLDLPADSCLRAVPPVLASFLLIPMLRLFRRALAAAASVVVIGTRGRQILPPPGSLPEPTMPVRQKA